LLDRRIACCALTSISRGPVAFSHRSIFALTPVLSVGGHAEHGYTLTRPDGLFDLAVNGGGRLLFHFEKTGFLAADAAPGWQRHERVVDVGLLEENKATSVVAANPDRGDAGGH
jgi:hypothetical protein